MGILLDTVRIAGFRGIKSLEIDLPRMTVLIGTNNSGKTSLLKALHLALGDYSRYLSEEDFHIGSDEKRALEIRVDIRIIAVDKNGGRAPAFNEIWADEFGDKIKAEANGAQYVALRTKCQPNSSKGGFDTVRSTLEKWPETAVWQTEKVKETRMTSRLLSVPFIFIEAQRDIHQDLREKSSFVGKILSSVEYDIEIVKALEAQIKAVNDEAVNSCADLKSLKIYLENLNHSFQGSGNAEITPFPKKIRDLSKHFSVHFGEDEGCSFPMEYHGMGTRSWASMLTVKAFLELMATRYGKEVKAFFPILAAEEPEAHLHPNAQKTIYSQLAESKGQVILSSHSPYLAAMAKQYELRGLKKRSESIKACQVSLQPETEESRKLQREVIHSRGEILFSNAIVLCEGETEEQALPLLFNRYFDIEAFVLGINIVGVGGSGKKYLPFLTFARDFDIPVFIFSDGEERTVKQLEKHYVSVFGETDINNSQYITILDNNDFESYLINSGFKTTIEAVIAELDGEDAIGKWIDTNHGKSTGRKKTGKPPCPSCKQDIFEDTIRDYKSAGGYEQALIDILNSGKTRYAPAIAEALCELEKDEMPAKIKELCGKIKAGALA